jgi:hypothetical protein
MHCFLGGLFFFSFYIPMSIFLSSGLSARFPSLSVFLSRCFKGLNNLVLDHFFPRWWLISYLHFSLPFPQNVISFGLEGTTV